MQADKETAKRLSELTAHARQQREVLEKKIADFKSHKSAHVGKLGVKAIQTASVMGLKNPKLIVDVARLVVIPAALGVGKFFLKHGSPRRAVGLALFTAGAIGVIKGIEFDNQKKAVKSKENDLIPSSEKQEP